MWARRKIWNTLTGTLIRGQYHRNMPWYTLLCLTGIISVTSSVFLGVANMGHLFVFYIHNRGSEWKIPWQQARGHCRNDFVMNDFPVLPHTAALWSIRKAFHSLKRRIPNAVCEKQTQLLLKGAGITLLTLTGLGTDSRAFKTNKKMHFFLHFMWRCDLSIIIQYIKY